MAAIEKISVALPADMLELVRRAVKSGDCATTSEVIREALREWKGRTETREEAKPVLPAQLRDQRAQLRLLQDPRTLLH